MKPLIIIPARGGSKGVPGKNIKCLGGKPLIQYTIEAARQVFTDDVICVSTDDERIKSIVEGLGLKVPFLRPAELATDKSGTYDVLLHALSHFENLNYNPDVVVLLQPTSPFRTAQNIKEAMSLYTKNLDMVVGVKETKSNPYFNCFEENEKGWLHLSKGDGSIIRRQDAPKAYEYNGAIYIINPISLRSTTLLKFEKKIKYIMDEATSFDIDTHLDWQIAELLIAIKKEQI